MGLIAVKARQKNNIPPVNETRAENTTIFSSNQPFEGPSSSRYSSAPKKAAKPKRPVQSKLFRRDKSGSSKSINAQHTVDTMIPGITFTRNSQCHENASVSRPPNVGPMVGAKVATRPITGPTMDCFSRGKIVKAAEKTVGIMPPPMKPWSARHRIISLMEPAVAQSMLNRVKPAAEATNTMRVENARDRNPESGIITTSATR